MGMGQENSGFAIAGRLCLILGSLSTLLSSSCNGIALLYFVDERYGARLPIHPELFLCKRQCYHDHHWLAFLIVGRHNQMYTAGDLICVQGSQFRHRVCRAFPS